MTKRSNGLLSAAFAVAVAVSAPAASAQTMQDAPSDTIPVCVPTPMGLFCVFVPREWVGG